MSSLKKLIPNIEKKLEKQGVELKKPISSGKYGIAFNIDDPKKVLKITTDSDEAKTSSKIIGKKFKNVVKIHRVFTFTSLPHIYFILQEKLKPLSTLDTIILEDALILRTYSTKIVPMLIKAYDKFKSYNSFNEFIGFRNFDELSKLKSVFQILKKKGFFDKFNLPAAYFLLEILKNYGITIYEEEPEDILDFITSNTLKQALNGLYELYSNNITFKDTHINNILKDDRGNLKWIDLGDKSKAPGKEKIEEIEGFKK